VIRFIQEGMPRNKTLLEEVNKLVKKPQ
jgi:hypothetical protein